jgi:twitching motility two-component system response regulator PilH
MKILIIEDDHFFVNFYSIKLKELGYQIESAVNGQEGLDKTRLFQPDLILLDMIMPVMDGFEFLDQYKKDPEVNHIPVIVFSTLGQETDVKKALAQGARDYINKSFFDFDSFLKRIVTYLPANPPQQNQAGPGISSQGSNSGTPPPAANPKTTVIK